MTGNPEAQFARAEHLQFDDEQKELYFFWLARAARQGHQDAMFQLARTIAEGEGLVRDQAEARRWYRLAAVAGHRDAVGELEDLAENAPAELVAEEGPDLAALRAAAEFDNPAACYWLAKALASLGSTDSMAEALEWLVWAARGGVGAAHLVLGRHCIEIGDNAGMLEHAMHGEKLGKEEPPQISVSVTRLPENARQLFETGVANRGRGDEEGAKQYFERAAAKGHAEAAYALAIIFKDGDGGADRVRSEQLMAAAAAGGHPESQFWMGKRLDYHEELYGKALGWYRRAADSGHADAAAAIAEHVISGKGIKKNVAQGVEMLRQAAGMGSVDAMLSLAHREDSIDWYRKAADAGSAEGDYEVAQRLIAKEDREGAEPYLRRAAEQGYQNAKSLLEDWIEDKTTHRSEYEALSKLADQGDIQAMIQLAQMDERGESPYQDPERAWYWYQMAADKGDGKASYITGKHLLDVPGGAQHGRDYLQFAAEKGNKDAKKLLKSLPKEEEPATLPDGEWQEDPLPASIAGNVTAQYQLGFAHFSGMGAKQSLPLAYFWLKIVGRSTPAVVEQMVDVIGQQIKKAQRAAMDRAVADWKVGMPPPAV